MSVKYAPFADAKNYVFVGEAGCGKSELAINLALFLKEKNNDVHLFDLDQTKPLFRSRDVKTMIENADVHFHFQEQYYDAPTLVSGITEMLARKDVKCVLDVGGNDTGSRVIGGFSALINRADTVVYFVINPFRPWSKSENTIAETLDSIMTASRLHSVRLICNPNIGYTTTRDDVMDGIHRMTSLIGTELSIDLVAVPESIISDVAIQCGHPVFPVRLFLQYPWTKP